MSLDGPFRVTGVNPGDPVTPFTAVRERRPEGARVMALFRDHQTAAQSRERQNAAGVRDVYFTCVPGQYTVHTSPRVVRGVGEKGGHAAGLPLLLPGALRGELDVASLAFRPHAEGTPVGLPRPGDLVCAFGPTVEKDGGGVAVPGRGGKKRGRGRGGGRGGERPPLSATASGWCLVSEQFMRAMTLLVHPFHPSFRDALCIGNTDRLKDLWGLRTVRLEEWCRARGEFMEGVTPPAEGDPGAVWRAYTASETWKARFQPFEVTHVGDLDPGNGLHMYAVNHALWHWCLHGNKLVPHTCLKTYLATGELRPPLLRVLLYERASVAWCHVLAALVVLCRFGKELDASNVPVTRGLPFLPWHLPPDFLGWMSKTNTLGGEGDPVEEEEEGGEEEEDIVVAG